MTTWNAAPMPELGLELVRDVDRERIRSRLPRWDPRLWQGAEFSKNTRPGNRLLKLGLAWGRERVKARKLQQENVTPPGDVAPVSRFTGKEEDVEVGLQYFGKRYLSPYLGRWISADPLAVHGLGKGGLNLYAYVDGRVLIVIDRVGLDWTWAQVAHTLNPLPSGRFGQYLAHGNFPTLQNDAAMKKIQNGVIAVTVGAEAAIVTGGLASAAGAGFWGTAAAAGVGYGAGERAQSAALEGASPTQQAKAAVATPAVVATDAVVGMGTAAGAELLGPAVKAVGRGGVPKWLSDFMKREAASTPAPTSQPQAGDTVYRVWGDEARPNGTYWTRTNPADVPNYRDAAGLPNNNSGEWISEGTLKDASGVEVTPGGATPLDGNAGGLDEIRVPNPSKQIEVTDVNKADPKK